MPMAIPLVIGLAASGIGVLGATGTLVAVGGVVISSGTLTAISIGLSVVGTLVSTLLQAQPPKPKTADGSQSVKQAVPPRTRCYGRYRLAGSYVYYDTNDSGDLYAVTHHCSHRIDAVEQHWLNDDIVELNAEGGVTTGTYQLLGTEYITVHNYLGLPDQSVTGLPGEWTVDHRLRGLNVTVVRYSDASAEDQLRVYPNGAPSYRETLRGALIHDPRDNTQVVTNEGTYKWSDNAALVVLDYLTRMEQTEDGPIPIGFGIPWAEINIDSFIKAANDSDSLINLKAGGTEKRWRLWGAYDLNEDRKQVLSDMLDCCGGRLTQTPDGRVGFDVGMPQPQADAVFTDEPILSYGIDQGVPKTDRINEIHITYIAEQQQWNETEAGIQVDQQSIDRNGIESSSTKLRFCPSEGQAQRVGRYLLRRGTPTFSGVITGDIGLLDAWGQRWVRLDSQDLAINQVFEIKSLTLNRNSDQATGVSVELELISYDDWWEWDPVTDEQAPASVPVRDPRPIDVPVPTGVTAAVIQVAIDINTNVPIGVVSWNPAPRTSLSAEGQWRKVGDPDWIPASVAKGQNTFRTTSLADQALYEGRVRFKNSSNIPSDWTAPVQFTAVADPIAPAPPVGLTANYSGGTVQLVVSAPNDPHFAALSFWRSTTASFVGATKIYGPSFGAPGIVAMYSDAPPTPGNWFYWATAQNRSGVSSTATGPQGVGIAPAVPVITTAAATVGNANPDVVGTAYPGAVVTVFVDGVLNQTTTATGGNWSVTLNGIALGARSITAKADVGGNVSGFSAAVILTRVWYDPGTSLEIDFKGLRYRLNGVDTDASVSGWAGLFGTLSLPDQIFDRGDGVLKRTAANVLPIGLGGLIAEVTRTNRNTNFNAAPVTGVTTNLTKGGAAAATLSTLADSANLAAGIFDASMSAVFTTGNAFILDNTAGATDAWVDFGGVVAGLTAHSWQCCVRGSAGTFECATSAVAIATFLANSAYQRIVRHNFTPGNAADVVRLRIGPGAAVAFTLNDLENAADASGPIVTAGAAATRASPNVLHVMGTEWNATEGYIGVRGLQYAAATGNGVTGIVQVDSSHRHYIQYLPPGTVRGLSQNSTNVGGPVDKTGITLSVINTAVYGYKNVDYAMSVNGTTVIAGPNTGAPPTGSFTLAMNNSTTALRGVIERWKSGKVKPANATIQKMAGWVIT